MVKVFFISFSNSVSLPLHTSRNALSWMRFIFEFNTLSWSHGCLPSTRRSYQISLTWLWSTRSRVTDSDQTVQRRIRTSAVLTFGLRVSRLNHSATRSLKGILECYLYGLNAFKPSVRIRSCNSLNRCYSFCSVIFKELVHLSDTPAL